MSACGNQTRGIFHLGRISSTKYNILDYITIASTGDAVDFGDLTQARSNVGALSNPTRGVFTGGYTPTQVNTIDYITIATLGNAQDFGDMTESIGTNSAQCASTTRGIIWGGYPAGTNIDYITIASKGNATSFGTSTTVSYTHLRAHET